METKETQSTNYWCQCCNCNGSNSKQSFIIRETEEESKEPKFCPNFVPNTDVVEEPLKKMGINVTGIRPKMTKEEIKKDRQARSTADFRKNTLPNFETGSFEANHFRKKHTGKT